MARKEKKTNGESSDQLSLNDVRELFQLVNRYGIKEFSFKEGGREIQLVSGRNTPSTPVADDAGDKQMGFQQFYPIVNPVIGPHQAVQAGFHPSQIPVQAAPAPSPAAADQPSAADKEKAKAREKLIAIKSPMVGTFYMAPSPDSAPYVEVGDEIGEDTVVCIVEAMKLFNEIKSDVKGKVVEILVANAQPVEYDQELFLIDPH